MAIAVHEMLYLDRNERTEKLKTMIAIANAAYGETDVEIVKKKLKDELDIFKEVKSEEELGSGSYKGIKKQWSSKYTLARDFGIIANSRNTIELSELAKGIVTGDITPKYFISTVLMNYIQIINNKIVHPLYSLLTKMNEDNITEIDKEYIKNILDFNLLEENNDKGNNSGGLLDIFKSSYFFKIYDENSEIIKLDSSFFSIKEILDNIDVSIFDKNIQTLKESYDKKNQKQWCEFITKPNELLINVFMPKVYNEDNIKDILKEPKELVTSTKINIINKAHNRLIYGAPGTGKSNMLEEDRKKYFEDENYERVTFYPDYSYGQFVGVYKPTNDGNYIKYEFVAGPFLRLLVEALKNKDKNYLVIVEEMNRANASAVFGDMFQLLDRDDDGKSKYAISISKDIKKYIASEGVTENKIYLPSNFYIWSTMNTADQGVTILDSAFKRRFDEYTLVGIDENEDVIEGITVNLNGVGEVNWNDFRKKLNKHLIDNFKVQEDKLIGPFFIKPNILTDVNKFNRAFTDKLLMYLAEDVLNHQKQKFFSSTSLSEIKSIYSKEDECVFKEQFWISEE